MATESTGEKSKRQQAFDMFTQVLAEQKAELDAKEEQLEKREQLFEAEKKRMMSVVVQDTDIIELNVGGRAFTTTRATLCVEEDTLLANMFSGRWEGSLRTDKKGRIFLNFDPDLFALLLNYLRDKELTNLQGKNTPKFPVCRDEDKRESFTCMLEYLGFLGSGKPTHNVRFSVTHSASQLTVSSDGLVVDGSTHTDSTWRFAKSAEVCVVGEAWKAKITNTGDSMVGIMPEGGTDCQHGYFFLLTNTPLTFNSGETFLVVLTADGVLKVTNDTTGVSSCINGVPITTNTHRWAFGSRGQQRPTKIELV
eukprot:GDKI01033267.1.p1 GENE.GDKI01033267.1~~GDKI01033267.1.p1  ORF type:complete len:326 (+),score=87.31 GDKI01033267.1:54-980(+)